MTGLELLLIGGALSAGSSIASGAMARSASRRTAARLEADAEERRRVGAIEGDLILEEGRRAEGAAIAQAAAGGFTVDDSVQDALASIARAHALDARSARYGASRDAMRMSVEAAEQRAQGTASLISGAASAGGTLLTTAARAKGWES